MGTYIARRLLLMIPTLIGITFLVFMLVALAPGGIGATLGVGAGGSIQSSSGIAVQQAYLEDRYGLNDPVIVQYVRWLARISPIKFGSRDQLAPSGDVISPPKAIAEPPAWRWFAATLPQASAASFDSKFGLEERTRAFRRAERDYAEARANYVAAVTMLKEQLVDFAKANAIEGGWNRKHEARVDAIVRGVESRGIKPDDKTMLLGKQVVAAYGAAEDARAALSAAFDAKPFPETGVNLIPGVLSLAWPDFGTAFSRGRPVIELIAAALPVTLLINLIAFPIIYMVAIPSGMLAATRRGTWLDAGLGSVFIMFWSFPVVLAGVLAIGFLASKDYLGAFPVSGLHDNAADSFRFLPHRADGRPFERGYLLDLLWHITLPVTCLVYGGFAVLSKQTRAAMLENFSADYVRTAKAKGVSAKDVIFKHVFRNSLLPLITLFVTIFPAMLAGSVVIERIFSIPGMGSLVIEAITLRDRELILANTVMIAVVNLLALLLADVLYALADPRVTYE